MAPAPDARRVSIPPLHELRLELEPSEAASVRLVAGTAEMFGFELLQGHDNPLGYDVKTAVFTWTGCDVEMSSFDCCRALHRAFRMKLGREGCLRRAAHAA